MRPYSAVAIMGRPPAELKTAPSAFARHPMAFLASPRHAVMQDPAPSLQTLAATHLLMRERGSGTRTTVKRLFKEASVPLRIGSEMLSNEAIKQMCAAGFGVAYPSLHTCMLELDAGVLQVIALPGNPVERDWFVIHLASLQLPQVAMALEQFLSEQVQAQVERQLGPWGAVAASVNGGRSKPRVASARKPAMH